MSGKRSFDIGPTRKTSAARSKRESRKKVTRAAPVRRAKPKNLRARREEARQRSQLMVVGVLLVLVGAGIYGLWRPEIRIQHVVVNAEHAESIEALLKSTMGGTYYYVIPKDSFFFYPEQTMRRVVLDEYPTLKSLSISRKGFTTLTVKTDARSTAFLWCGTPEAASDTCYQADAEGLIFASTTATSTDLTRMRGFLNTASSTDATPIRARVIGYEFIPDVLTFAETIAAFGTPISSIAIRGDEVDLFVESGTRITYVLGHEKEAAVDARAALPTLNLQDGSIEYVDLRFADKVYLKRKE